MDTPGYHPVHNPNPNLFGTHEPGMGGLSIPPAVPTPAKFPMNRNTQGLHGFMIPTGRGPAWEQQLHDTL